MLTTESCDLFNLPFFQFSQLKQYYPEKIPQIKAEYKKHWEIWKRLNLLVYQKLGVAFAQPHIEKWCNGWQVRAHFFAYYKYAVYQNSAVILSVILNRRRLLVSLDWHSYRANRSQNSLAQYNQWLIEFKPLDYRDFEIWRGVESEYDDFRSVKSIQKNDLILEKENDFFCIGRNIEKAELNHIDSVDFICCTINQLLPLYESCHKSIER